MVKGDLTQTEEYRRREIIKKHFEGKNIKPTLTCMEIYLGWSGQKFNRIFRLHGGKE